MTRGADSKQGDRGTVSAQVARCRGARRARASARRHAGFTLIDLMVSVSVMALLISILTPAIAHAQKAAQRVRCQSNIRQLGLAFQMYADAYGDRFPTSAFTGQRPGTTYKPQEMMHFRLGEGHAFGSPDEAHWDGLGVLIEEGFLTHPGVCYCPSHQGHHPQSAYADQWRQGSGDIVGNYHYRAPRYAQHITELSPRLALIADGMRTQLDYSHVVGTNVLRVDQSVAWFSDKSKSIYNRLTVQPDDVAGRQVVDETWGRIDSGSSADDPTSSRRRPLPGSGLRDPDRAPGRVGTPVAEGWF